MALTAGLNVRWIPRDLTESSWLGGIFTILAYLLMIIIFLCELSSFSRSDQSMSVILDRFDSELLQINFDIDMIDIECRNVQIVVISATNDEPIPISSSDFWLRSTDSKGRTFGMASKPTQEDEDAANAAVHQRQMKEIVKNDGQAEIDADWASSHDGFRHQSFEHVIRGHDFVAINFFAGWCSHCQVFAPTWAELANETNGDDTDRSPKTFADRDGVQRQVRLLKVNCVDFKDICQEKGVDAYPTIRLYKADGSFALYEGRRSKDDIIKWIERTVKMKSYGWADNAEAFERGCNAKGKILVPRVPGHLELMAGGGDQNLNPSMTNVSHLVKHLSFSNPDNSKSVRKSWTALPSNVLKFVSPLDGKSYATKAFHEAWIHDLKVVNTVNAGGAMAYQFTHQHRLARIDENIVPQAQFHYDIEPFAIFVSKDGKQWYNFVTSTMAMLGGIYATMKLMSSTSLGLMKVIFVNAFKPRGGGDGRLMF